MKKYFFTIVICMCFSSIFASELSTEKQYDILQRYMHLTGQLSQSQSTAYLEQHNATEIPIKCGTPAILDFKQNYSKFDSHILKSAGIQIEPRPNFHTDSLVSPSGKFMVHYSTTGTHAVYNNVPGGASGYVDSVASILDDVYDHIINTLGYPEPIHDSFYVEGGDEKFDVYLVEINGPFYGLTYADSIMLMPNGDSLATSFLFLDNDYKELPQYKNRPLDAVRVTAAHEFFHMVQFGLDVSESEIRDIGVEGPAWMEMTSVWMEEEMYDDINDYYNYLPTFFGNPKASLQQFLNNQDLHAYASGIFPIYLSQKFGRDIIKSIWTKCGEYGQGPHSLQVIDEVVDSASSGSETYESMFAEFALWNYFTGSRAHLAPSGVGYEERENYVPEFTDYLDSGKIKIEFNYPTGVLGTNSTNSPFNNGSFYLSLFNTDILTDSYAYTDSTVDTILTDSVIITYIDSVRAMDFIVALDTRFTNPWGGNFVYQYKDYPDSIDVEPLIFPAGFAALLKLPEPEKYKSITLILSPASSTRSFYTLNNQWIARYQILSSISLDSLNPDVPSSIFFPYPNPAVINEMANKSINFKFQYTTDSTGFPVNLLNPLAFDPYMIVDIFNVNGEYIRSIDQLVDDKSDIFKGIFVAEWDMKNQNGEDVASGVYLAYARIFGGNIDGQLLAEQKAKIAVIR